MTRIPSRSGAAIGARELDAAIKAYAESEGTSTEGYAKLRLSATVLSLEEHPGIAAENPGTTADAVRTRIAELARALGPDELAVLALVAQGLVRGRSVYGELDTKSDRRDFRREASEELRDTLVYMGAELVRLQRGQRT